MRRLYQHLLPFICLTLLSGTSIALARSSTPNLVYLTDLEGSWTRFQTFLSESDSFFLGGDGNYHLKPGVTFVYGGDATDRFLGSFKVLDELNRLKEESGESVQFILGNRDVNWIRIPVALSDAEMKKTPRDNALTGLSFEKWLSAQPDSSNSKVNRLKWMLAERMGAPDAFRLAKEELKNSNCAYDDEAVLAKFLSATGPNGSATKYLRAGNYLYRDGKVLIAHGGITDDNYLRLPDGRFSSDLSTWIQELNGWYRRHFADWELRGRNWDGAGAIPGGELVNYQIPRSLSAGVPLGVVNGRVVDGFGQPALPSQKVIRDLIKNGIHWYFLGHTPSGQIPVVLSGFRGRFYGINADNSRYSNEAFASHVTVRGKKQSTVTIAGKLEWGGEPPQRIGHAIHLGRENQVGNRFGQGLLIAPYQRGLLSYHMDAARGYRVSYQVHDWEAVRGKTTEPFLGPCDLNGLSPTKGERR